MKDLHSHLLYGIDDGSLDISESISILKEAKEQGIIEIILTPHYIENSSYNYNNEEKKKRLSKLIKEVKKEHLNIKLYLGNEIMICDNILELLEEKKITTLNNSKYLLIEFPLENMLYNTKDIIYNLVLAGYIPIISHPERYRIFQRHPDHIEEYLRMGVLLQGNYQSLFGIYGRNAKKTLKTLLKKGRITFLASDTHHDSDFKVEKLKKKLRAILKDKKVVEDIINNNFDKVITNEDFGIKR